MCIKLKNKQVCILCSEIHPKINIFSLFKKKIVLLEMKTSFPLFKMVWNVGLL